MSDRIRKAIYAVGTPLGALAVFYGLMSDDEVALWLAAAGGAVLAFEGVMAAINTPTTPKSGPSA